MRFDSQYGRKNIMTTLRAGVLLLCLAAQQILFAGDPESAPATPTPTPPAADQEFQIQLNIENGHIGQVYIGCKPGATDEFDGRVDDMAPPPGMGGIGYTFLVSPDRKYNLYKDIRGFADRVQWVFYAKTGVKPVQVSWEPQAIPKGWTLYCGAWDGTSEEVTGIINCRQTTTVETKKTGFFRFWIIRETAENAKP